MRKSTRHFRNQLEGKFSRSLVHGFKIQERRAFVNSDRVANMGCAPTFNDNLVQVAKIDEDAVAALASKSRQPVLMEHA
jgi:hypothetical protein